jgi:hypothetical protein
VSFVKKNNDRRRFDPHKQPRFVLPRRPPVQVIRVVLLALLGAIAAGWAIAYHYSVRLPPMLKPVTPPAATFDPDAGEIPVPEIETAP